MAYLTLYCIVLYYSYIVGKNLFLQMLLVASITLYCVCNLYVIVCSVLLHFRSAAWCL